MVALPYGNQAELDAFFTKKHPGDQVTKAELFTLKSLGGLSVPQKRKVIEHYEGLGMLVHGEGGAIYYKHAPPSSVKPDVDMRRVPAAEPPPRRPDIERPYSTPFSEEPKARPAFSNVAREIHLPDSLGYKQAAEPASQKSDYPFVSSVPRSPALDPKIAYEFFDPNMSIFRGIVVTEAGWDFEKEKSQSTGVEVLLPEGYTRFGLVSPRHERLYRSKENDRMRIIANTMKKGELVLVRRVDEFTGKSGKPTWLFEPLLYLVKDDNATLNGERIWTAVEANRILNLPIVEPGKERDGLVNGVGYVPEGFGVIPVYVDGAGNKVWTVVPEVSARKISSEKEDSWGFKRNRIWLC